ncbi:MAG: hypothetical protein HRT71_00320 [Flavobacteriales bacterium]|nr:hypothetical protein [Flavobacteriales bacterium]
MPIEIREIVIKTEVRHNNNGSSDTTQKEAFNQMRNQMLAECRKMLLNESKRKRNKR